MVIWTRSGQGAPLIIIALGAIVCPIAYFFSETRFPLIGGDEPWAYIVTHNRLLVGNHSTGWVECEWPFSKPEGFNIKFSGKHKHIWIYSAKHREHEMWVADFHYSSASKALTSFDEYVNELTTEFSDCKKVNFKYSKTCKFNPSNLTCLPDKKGYPIIDIKKYSTFECNGKIVHIEQTGNSIFVAIASKSEEKFMQDALALCIPKPNQLQYLHHLHNLRLSQLLPHPRH
ncbi:hypothetical protein DRP05_08355 [Archaeoglobales archaeon]|nr:MAG: hypothetical protein DRP05_08355 [Archaeoglobales archaeon]